MYGAGRLLFSERQPVVGWLLLDPRWRRQVPLASQHCTAIVFLANAALVMVSSRPGIRHLMNTPLSPAMTWTPPFGMAGSVGDKGMSDGGGSGGNGGGDVDGGGDGDEGCGEAVHGRRVNTG